MENQLEEIYKKLHEQDYKITPQRQVILKAFLNNAKEHLSAEEVYNIVKGQYPDIGLATVYRTLDLLVDLDILQRINFGDGRARYEFSSRAEHHHHHLICLACGKVLEFDHDLLESLENFITKKTDFQITDHQLKFFGYCRECREKGQEKP
ncbi:ferric uptake regulator, Fur family [Thermanaeromonas toyohensis ToBE]|uniref:Ferric uptake regulator, Fur family n=1 Tax=Thermanaeromonas toyohensis ToBE TaxID=698762 RepID=A0A1W1VXS6_9FIRM|nr:Fur family transcriptional regulator [Thermanaeromonas toyohensis]SMB97891.1 ferric uptake regulator, Fur family [Thermanaeromonas toyohensis ToBE]